MIASERSLARHGLFMLYIRTVDEKISDRPLLRESLRRKNSHAERLASDRYSAEFAELVGRDPAIITAWLTAVRTS